MSIQIYNDGLAGAAASGTGRTQDVSPATTGGKPASGLTTGGEDSVQISSLSSDLSSRATQHAARVQELAAAYQSGQYEPNSMNISKALVNYALQAGGAESEE